MTLYEKFQKLPIDFSALGLERRDTDAAYFCTPVGAEIIGWAGVDGIHYCFVEGFGGMVFAVSPMNLPGECVRPIARSFEDMLRLLLACGSMDAIEQTNMFDEAGFGEYIAENPPAAAREEAFAVLRERLGITPMERPFEYIRELQGGFDCSRIKFSDEYYELAGGEPEPEGPPEWRVTYDGGFFPRSGRKGRELAIGRSFAWGDEVWHVPAAYIFGKGLVVDFCVEVRPERMRAFIDKWGLCDKDRAHTRGEQELMRAENPLDIGFLTHMTANGKPLRHEHGTGFSWIPPEMQPEGEAPVKEAGRLLEHYGLDRGRCWSFHRLSLAWAAKRAPSIRSLRLRLEREPAELPGPRLVSPKAGDEFDFTHPATGRTHTLTVREYETQEMDERHFHDERFEYPTHYTAMTYTVHPELGQNAVSVRDCAEGDRPRLRQAEPGGPAAASAALLGIIRSDDGPTAVFYAGGSPARPRAAISSLYFEPRERIEWRVSLHEKLLEDIEVTLI